MSSLVNELGNRILISAATLLVLAGCGAPTITAQESSASPVRIVSLDYCADQYLLGLVEPERILALSLDATADFSYLRDRAAGQPQVPSRAEDVLVLQPDLVLRSYGGGPSAQGFFERAGVPVVNVGWTRDLAGIRETVRRLGIALAAPDRAEALITQMDQRLSVLRQQTAVVQGTRSVLYLTPGGVTTGPGTLMNDMLQTAGLRNFQEQAGWQPVPLERLVYEQPDLLAGSFFETRNRHGFNWSASRHPVAQALLTSQPVAQLDGSATACGAWFLLDAVEQLAATAEAL